MIVGKSSGMVVLISFFTFFFLADYLGLLGFCLDSLFKKHVC